MSTASLSMGYLVKRTLLAIIAHSERHQRKSMTGSLRLWYNINTYCNSFFKIHIKYIHNLVSNNFSQNLHYMFRLLTDYSGLISSAFFPMHPRIIRALPTSLWLTLKAVRWAWLLSTKACIIMPIIILGRERERERQREWQRLQCGLEVSIFRLKRGYSSHNRTSLRGSVPLQRQC